jgi:hypothetical protein
MKNDGKILRSNNRYENYHSRLKAKITHKYSKSAILLEKLVEEDSISGEILIDEQK